MPFPNLKGRPLKLNKKHKELIKEYYNNCVDNDRIPFFEEVAILLDITDDTLQNWSKKDTDIRNYKNKILNLQKLMLQKNSLNGKYNPTASIFQLKCNHGFIETSRQEIKQDIKLDSKLSTDDDLSEKLAGLVSK